MAFADLTWPTRGRCGSGIHELLSLLGTGQEPKPLPGLVVETDRQASFHQGKPISVSSAPSIAWGHFLSR